MKPKLRLEIFAYHVVHIVVLDVGEGCKLNPCDGVNADVERIGAEAYRINGEHVGNLNGAYKAFSRMVDSAMPELQLDCLELTDELRKAIPKCREWPHASQNYLIPTYIRRFGKEPTPDELWAWVDEMERIHGKALDHTETA